MSNIIVVSNERKVKTLLAYDKGMERAYGEFDELVQELIEIDPDARPLYPQQTTERNGYFVISQQWAYTQRNEG